MKKEIGALAVVFSWIFFVLLTHEIYTRPIVIRETQPAKWYQVEASANDYSISFYLSTEDGGIRTRIIEFTSDEISIGEISIGSTSSISPTTWIDNLQVREMN